MKPIAYYLFLCLLLLFGGGGMAVPPALAVDSTADPVINLAVNNQPLGEVLDAITAETGYEFNINSQWETHPVSATISDLPLEQGLKRLLRSLNHTIIWEADQTITIMVYGKSAAGSGGGGISHAAPPQSFPATPPSELEDPDEERDDPSPADEAPEPDDRETAEIEEDASPNDENVPGQGRIKRPPSPRPPPEPGAESGDTPPE